MPGGAYNFYRLIEGYEKGIATLREFLRLEPTCELCRKTATIMYGGSGPVFFFCDTCARPMSRDAVEVKYAPLIRWLDEQDSVTDLEAMQEAHAQQNRRTPSPRRPSPQQSRRR